jgi:protein-disulfide isomerase
LRKQVWIAGGGLAVLVAAGVAAFAVSERSEAPPPAAGIPAATAAADSPASAAAGGAGAPAASTQTQLAQADPEAPALYPDDKVLGSVEAPVTVIEYASLTCPHCAHFDADTFPRIKENYIDTGLVRFVYRDFPLDGAALHAALLAHCVPQERYFNMLEVLFRSQAEWASSDEEATIKALSRIGRTAGLNQEKLDACFGNQAETERILLRMQEAESRYQVRSTPSFIINGQKVTGSLPYDEFDEILKGALP